MDDSILLPVEKAHQELSLYIYIYIHFTQNGTDDILVLIPRYVQL